MTDKQPYAELPDWDSGDEPIWEAIFQWKDAKQGIEAHKKSLAVEQAIVSAMRAFADATHALRAALAAPQQEVQEPEMAYRAACRLATALFNKHYAHLPDYSSGGAVWGLCDSTAGVISQIDNMVATLVQPAPSGDAEDAQRWRTFIGLPYAIRSEWACNLSMASVLTQWVDQATADAALAAQGGV